MKNIVYIYQYNELNNGHSIFDKRLSSALKKIYGAKYYAEQYDVKTNKFVGDTSVESIDNGTTIIILSHINTFRIAGWFKKSKVIFINHDLPYYAYLLQKNVSGLIKSVYSWLYIHYYWKKAAFIFFISKAELKKSGVPPEKSLHIRVGVRPDGNLTNFSAVLPVAIFTGNYKWSLKAKALRNVFRNKYNGKLKLTAVNVDGTFSEIASSLGADVVYNDNYPAGEEIKFGIITDDFLSGFKLKALELIHAGCCLVSFSNIINEFDDIPYTNLFIYIIKDLNELDIIYDKLISEPDILGKYKVFYDGICTKFNWDKTAADIENVLSKF